MCNLVSVDGVAAGAGAPVVTVAEKAPTRAYRFVLPEGGVKLDEVEKDLLEQALERTGGNRTRAGGLLGLSRDQVRYRIERYGIK